MVRRVFPSGKAITPFYGHLDLFEIYRYAGYVEQYLKGEIKVDEMVTHTMELEEINKAFELMHSGESIRSVVIY